MCLLPENQPAYFGNRVRCDIRGNPGHNSEANCWNIHHEGGDVHKLPGRLVLANAESPHSAPHNILLGLGYCQPGPVSFRKNRCKSYSLLFDDDVCGCGAGAGLGSVHEARSGAHSRRQRRQSGDPQCYHGRHPFGSSQVSLEEACFLPKNAKKMPWIRGEV